MDDQSFQHGTKSGYQRHKCKCDACRAWKREQDRKRRARLKQSHDLPDYPHGTEAGYSKGSCRCDPCRAAYAEAMAKWREDNPGRHQQLTRAWRGRLSADLSPEARHHGDQWTGAELEVVVRSDLSVPQMAKMLGRTFPATASARWRAMNDPKWIQVVGTSRTISEDSNA